jgi:hypothetical protein
MFFINLIMLLFILATLAFILSKILKQKEPFSLQLQSNTEDLYKSYQNSPSTFLNTLLSDYHDVYKEEIVPRGGIVNFHKQSLNNY